MQQLRITEIFYSLQGETKTVGLPTVFVRLTGCPLRCQYCDTDYAFKGGTQMLLPAILDKVASFSPKYITVTGGEPLAQKASLTLLKQLCDKNYNVSLETSGAMPIRDVDSRVIKILDLKTPGSLEQDKNLWENIDYLTQADQVKFVICHRQDYDWAKTHIEKHQLLSRCDVLLSPSYKEQPADKLANWILEDNLAVRFQLQMHKVIWGDIPGV